MDTNGPSKAMSVPPAPLPPVRVQQSSIRSFFHPRTPNYTAPPTAQNSQLTTASSISPPIPSSQTQASSPPPSNNGATAAIPEQATISHVDPSHIQPLRRINSLLLPINYPDSFYHKILDPSSAPSFSRVILWQDDPSHPPKVIGGIVCRVDPSLAPDSTPTVPKYVEGVCDIYVQSLALLSPYRSHGLAAAALKSVIDSATAQIRVKIAGLYAHVWTENAEALEWYAARGFKKEEPVINGYYKRLKPDSAWILRRRLGVGDHLFQLPSSPQRSAPAPLKENVSPATTAPPKALPTQTRPPAMTHAASFQDRRPDREWNDLPEDVLDASLLKPPSGVNSNEGSATSSRSSSRSGTKKKKERLYPAAAFGS